MAFNGITVAALCREISDRVTGGRIYKIAQTESDEIILTIRPEISRGGGQLRLLLSADASLPLCYFTELAKPSPAQAPAFCMLLRKHLSNAKISSVSQPGLERILRFRIEHRNEMGDLCFHTLVLELMGKYSNLILLDEHEEIVDSIKRVSSMVSSVREVLPGRPYFVPDTQNKRDALTETEPAFYAMLNSERPPAALLVRSYTGFSDITGEELVFRAGIEHDLCAGEMTREEKDRLWAAFCALRTAIQNGDFEPTVYGVREALPGSADAFRPSAFSPFSLLSVESAAETDSPAASRRFESMSELLEFYYGEKNKFTRIRQRTADLRRTVQTLLERDLHKHELQTKQLKDTEKRDKYRIFGELLNAYGYNIPEGSRSAVLDNYYTGEKLTVPLDPALSVSANARRCFDRYNKLKRTADALLPLLEDTQAEIVQLQNIQVSLELSADEASLSEIREELEKSGLLHRSRAAKTGKGAKKEKTRAPQSHPFHYRSSDGYDIYVGKNNLQNDALTFRLAGGNDIWFHANDMPGSHVILKTNGQKMEEIPDRTFEEAAALAAYYSSGRTQGRVEIDYLLRREVKKPAGSRPGFVIYHSNYSMMAGTDISGIKEVISS
ncbi:Rqc2 family fibronectin-binding protein [Lachnoclostridium sp. Marseille-P6806]|uniref:Rqc2 family fibronectin-binding protein n=1 Tax=Lachnoclostridium sp. Marseille-P6806 TaxID=2364793 RepID=UPI0010325E91|nr:NFACT RNA binding domain-containing protein [Lachnoclostridium sp. Marseille-P6806]